MQSDVLFKFYKQRFVIIRIIMALIYILAKYTKLICELIFYLHINLIYLIYLVRNAYFLHDKLRHICWLWLLVKYYTIISIQKYANKCSLIFTGNEWFLLFIARECAILNLQRLKELSFDTCSARNPLFGLSAALVKWAQSELRKVMLSLINAVVVGATEVWGQEPLKNTVLYDAAFPPFILSSTRLDEYLDPRRSCFVPRVSLPIGRREATRVTMMDGLAAAPTGEIKKNDFASVQTVSSYLVITCNP